MKGVDLLRLLTTRLQFVRSNSSDGMVGKDTVRRIESLTDLTKPSVPRYNGHVGTFTFLQE